MNIFTLVLSALSILLTGCATARNFTPEELRSIREAHDRINERRFQAGSALR
jgi:hypothetical protein